ncbi:DUF6984 family protein [Roseivirga sp. 4D4]|uniref:DUF6984 family protein n=1 Tax=Roseivirga sp. 4D4 TaxID=1889784 RepID=UPI0009F25C12|nr:hypothetical protein [Roseivirga sp. 4D4]
MRQIKASEKAFICCLLEKAGRDISIPDCVISLKDGEMGSLSFDTKGAERRQGKIVSGVFKDKDGVIVDFELTVDVHGRLFELDLFKTNYNPLISLPEPSEITFC